MKIFNREFRYFEGKPVMVLIPVGRDNGFRWFVKLEDLWKYSDTHNEQFFKQAKQRAGMNRAT